MREIIQISAAKSGQQQHSSATTSMRTTTMRSSMQQTATSLPTHEEMLGIFAPLHPDHVPTASTSREGGGFVCAPQWSASCTASSLDWQAAAGGGSVSAGHLQHAISMDQKTAGGGSGPAGHGEQGISKAVIAKRLKRKRQRDNKKLKRDLLFMASKCQKMDHLLDHLQCALHCGLPEAVERRREIISSHLEKSQLGKATEAALLDNRLLVTTLMQSSR